jgi:hypothetical protein
LRVLAFVLLVVTLVDAAKKRNTGPRGKRAVANQNLTVGVYIIIGLFVLCFIPGIIILLYSIYADPMTPQLWTRLLDVIKGRTLSFLSTPTNKDTRTSAAKRQ